MNLFCVVLFLSSWTSDLSTIVQSHDKQSECRREPTCPSHSLNPSRGHQFLLVLSNHLQLFPSLSWELQRDTANPLKAEAFLLLTFPHVQTTYATYIFYESPWWPVTLSLHEGRTPGFVSRFPISSFSLTLPMKMNSGVSSHQEISCLHSEKNSLAASTSIKSYKHNFWEQNCVCQMADVIPQPLTRVTMAHSAVSWAALNNVRTKR